IRNGAEKLLLNLAVLRDEKRCREADHAAKGVDDIVITHGDGIFDLELFDLLFDIRYGSGLDSDADQLEILARIPFLQRVVLWNLFLARVAPGCPEIEDRNLALQIRRFKRA